MQRYKYADYSDSLFVFNGVDLLIAVIFLTRYETLWVRVLAFEYLINNASIDCFNEFCAVCEDNCSFITAIKEKVEVILQLIWEAITLSM